MGSVAQPSGNTGNIPTFWYVGRDGGNPNYLGSVIRNFVGKIYPGKKFRFREDPTQEIYTIQADVGSQKRIRWQRKTTGFPSQTEIANNINDDDYGFIDNSIQMSPNFSKNWKPRFINESGNGTVNWDPTGGLGPITNGLELAINHSSIQVWSATSNDKPWVMVDSLLATDEVTGKTHNITTGMILTSHSDGITDATYDGTVGTYSLEELAIETIQAEAGGFKLRLSGYRQILTETDNDPVAGLKEHQIWQNKPLAAQEMIFKQPKMNLKNLRI